MPLSPTELRDEELAQLRRLVQSPAWDLYKTHVLKRVVRNEQEKAKALRESNPTLAVQLQARIDGLLESLNVIAQAMEGLHEPRESEVAY